jgi:hypothetical protein
VPPAIFRRPRARADRLAPGRGPSGRQAGALALHQAADCPAPARGPYAPMQRAPPRLAPGRGPSGRCARTIRPCAEGTATVLVECLALQKGVNKLLESWPSKLSSSALMFAPNSVEGVLWLLGSHGTHTHTHTSSC